MKNMRDAIHLSGAHIVFKQVRENQIQRIPALKKMKVPLAPGVKRSLSKKTQQRIVCGIPRDPVDRQAAIVTSRTPKDCRH